MYYPKSKILESQFTSGKEFVLKRNNSPYKGYYYVLSNNKFFTGKTYQDPNTEELIRVQNIAPKVVVSNIATVSDFVLPFPFYPKPTEDDYNLGFITRYFIKRRNANFTTIIEISPNDYDKNFSDSEGLDTNLYVATKVNWKISDPNIEDTNKKLIQLKEKLFPGFSFFFKDFKQFSK